MAREAAARGGRGGEREKKRERERDRARQSLFFETGCPKNITTPLLVSSGFAQFLPSREDHTGFARALRPAAERRSLGPTAPGSRCAAPWLPGLPPDTLPVSIERQNQTQKLIFRGKTEVFSFFFFPEGAFSCCSAPKDKGEAGLEL